MNFFTKIAFFTLLTAMQINIASEETTSPAYSENLKTINAFVNMSLSNHKTTLETFNDSLFFAKPLINSLTPSEKTIASQIIKNAKTKLIDRSGGISAASHILFLKSCGIKSNSLKSSISKKN